ncbi:hypothetical protein J3459_003986 [Metarhizium acridum]|uniref:uncharacterized protein n=1 Tax=Metarhizium acridum TaxID=92637 RepID=UPI001C6AC953|nr:hypothetical protein J3458_002881 [Metarhizium acridum]KAG8428378.1 hypothetical protein J3459_003986 [Metarhizium acridum]
MALLTAYWNSVRPCQAKLNANPMSWITVSTAYRAAATSLQYFILSWLLLPLPGPFRTSGASSCTASQGQPHTQSPDTPTSKPKLPPVSNPSTPASTSLDVTVRCKMHNANYAHRHLRIQPAQQHSKCGHLS